MSLPSYYNDHATAWEYAGDLLRLCRKLKVDTVAGPVTSGVVIAMACFMRSCRSKYKVKALLLGKEGYRREKHGSGPKIMGTGQVCRVLVVDDCVSSGDAMVYAVKELQEFFRWAPSCGYIDCGAEIVGCASKYIHDHAISRVREICPDAEFFSMNDYGD